MTVARVRLRRGTAAQWASANPVLAPGEPGFETDTGIVRVGDGATAWSSLPLAGPQGPTGPPGADGSGVPAGGAAGTVLTKASATSGDVVWAAPAPVAAWTVVDDLPLTTLTGWTPRSGTWDLSGPGGTLKQTSTTGGLTSRIDLASGLYAWDAACMRFEVYLHGSGGAERRAWGLCAWDGTSTGAPVGGVRWTTGDHWVGAVEKDAVTAGIASADLAGLGFNQWITVAHLNWGGTSHIYVGGVRVVTWQSAVQVGAPRTHLGLYTYSCDASFRNLTGWKATAATAPF